MIKQYFLIISAIIFMSACAKQEPEVFVFSFFQNNGADGLHLAYSYDAYNWIALNDNQSFLVPTAGKDKLMRDPCIIKGGDGKFHMVWTVSWNEKGIGYTNTTDLINWSEQKYIPVMHHEPDARNCWAPEIYYDEQKDQYLIHWATTIPGRFPETDTLGDDAYNHRMYYTTTKDFVDFTKTKILYDDGLNVIDANINLINEKFVMFLKNETLLPDPEKNIRIATSNNLYGDYSSASEAISENWVEGPTAVRLDTAWVVYFDKYTDNTMGAISSSDLVNWNDISDKINFPIGTHHGSIFKVKQSVLDKLIDQANK